jgi:hypothetical protein
LLDELKNFIDGAIKITCAIFIARVFYRGGILTINTIKKWPVLSGV